MGSVKRSSWRKFIPYLLLNAVVSVLAVLIVLFFWNRRPTPPQLLPTPTTNIATEIATLLPAATATLLPSPTPNVYVIKTGDTLFAIAIELDISMDALMAANNMSNPDELSVGQALLIPSEEWVAAFEERSAIAASLPSPTPTEVVEPPHVEIRGVEGAGNLEREAIRFLNTGGVAEMKDWRLDDGRGHIYLFPTFTLHSGAFNLNVRTGDNTPIDLFWGLTSPILDSVEVLTLRDADGDIHATFEVETSN
jgi:LysM repeat protein